MPCLVRRVGWPHCRKRSNVPVRGNGMSGSVQKWNASGRHPCQRFVISWARQNTNIENGCACERCMLLFPHLVGSAGEIRALEPETKLTMGCRTAKLSGTRRVNSTWRWHLPSGQARLVGWCKNVRFFSLSFAKHYIVSENASTFKGYRKDHTSKRMTSDGSLNKAWNQKFFHAMLLE